jgi:hypothetical protein
VQSPFAWSDDGHELAYQYQNDLAVMTFTDPANYWTDRPFRIVAHAYSPKEPAWIGDRIFFVNPWKLDVAAAAGNDQRNLVSDYVGSLRVPIRNQSVLFLSIGADSDVANRHIERIALDGSDRRVVANPIPGHQIQDYAVSPEGDTVAFWAVGE